MIWVSREAQPLKTMKKQPKLETLVKTWQTATITGVIADYKERIADCKRDKVDHKRWAKALVVLQAELLTR